jgi:hypothetical protein
LLGKRIGDPNARKMIRQVTGRDDRALLFISLQSRFIRLKKLSRRPHDAQWRRMTYATRARGPIPTEASLRSGESAHQINGQRENSTVLSVGFYPLAAHEYGSC